MGSVAARLVARAALAAALAACGAKVIALDGAADPSAPLASSGAGTAPHCTPMQFQGDRSGAFCLVSDARYVYWDTLHERIERADPVSGEVKVVTDHTGTGVQALAVTDAWLYLVGDHALRRVSTAGGSLETVATGEWNVRSAVASGSDVYFVDDGSAYLEGRLMRWSPSSGLAVLATGLAAGGLDLCQGALGQDADAVFVLIDAAKLGGQLVDHPAVLSVPKGGGAPSIIEPGVPGWSTGMFVGDQRIFVAWAVPPGDNGDPLDSGISAVAKSGGKPKLLPLPHGAVSAFEVVALGDDAFLSGSVPQPGTCCGSGPGVLWRVPLSGAPPSLLTTDAARLRLARAASGVIATRAPDSTPTTANAELFCP